MVMFRTVKAMTLISLLLVAGCGAKEQSASKKKGDAIPKPSVEMIRKIEFDISRDACVGSPHDWQRLYAFRNRDERIVRFAYREAGKFGFVPGARVRDTEDWDAIDDRPYKRVDGSYDVRTSKLNIEYCGLNAPEAPTEEGPDNNS